MVTRRSLHWDGSAIVAVDQCALPITYRHLRLSTVDEVVDAIERLTIHGASALGVAGALAVVLSATAHTENGRCDEVAVRADARRLAAARPTSVTLGRAVRRALDQLAGGVGAVLDEALAMIVEDEQVNRAAASRAADVVLRLTPRRPLRLYTHCNTGHLASVAWGTALGAVRTLAGAGLVGEVLFGETRPLLTGARLTAWELAEAGIPHRMCVDSAGPAAIATGLVDCVLVGANRVCANGDVANEIGTYPLALAAGRAGVPFVVVTPAAAVDLMVGTGSALAAEHRTADEVTSVSGIPITRAGTEAFNPAFDVVPADLVTAVVTEHGVLRAAA